MPLQTEEEEDRSLSEALNDSLYGEVEWWEIAAAGFIVAVGVTVAVITASAICQGVLRAFGL